MQALSLRLQRSCCCWEPRQDVLLCSFNSNIVQPASLTVFISAAYITS